MPENAFRHILIVSLVRLLSFPVQTAVSGPLSPVYVHRTGGRLLTNSTKETLSFAAADLSDKHFGAGTQNEENHRRDCEPCHVVSTHTLFRIAGSAILNRHSMVYSCSLSETAIRCLASGKRVRRFYDIVLFWKQHNVKHTITRPRFVVSAPVTGLAGFFHGMLDPVKFKWLSFACAGIRSGPRYCGRAFDSHPPPYSMQPERAPPEYIFQAAAHRRRVSRRNQLFGRNDGRTADLIVTFISRPTRRRLRDVNINDCLVVAPHGLQVLLQLYLYCRIS